MKLVQVTAKFQKAFLLVVIIVHILSYSSAAQQDEKFTPLHKFFQENYDSTIIYHSWSNGYSAPNYQIAAKQNNKLYYFTYTSPYKKLLGRNFPGSLSKTFTVEENKFERTDPDTNRYLLPKKIMQPTLSENWNNLQALNLWQLKDDKHTLESTGSCMIEDGNTNTFYLIDKEGMNVLNFYEPDFWEECLGKHPNRQKAIRARTAFQRIAKQE